MARLYTNWIDKNINGAEVAANSLAVTRGRLVAIKSGFANLAVAGDAVVWISVETKTFAADNETAAKSKLNYIALDDYSEVEVTVVWGTIAQANIGSLYDLDANGDVDAAAGTPSQLKLVKVVNSTKWIFVKAK